MPSVLKHLVLGSLLLSCACSKPITRFHLGPWEQEIGYTQALQVGNHVYISGSVGSTEGSVEEQMKEVYATIQKTLEHYKANFSNIVVERIYTTDIDALIKCQEYRKTLYGDHLPAATWVEVKRLYSSRHKIEIEVELEL